MKYIKLVLSLFGLLIILISKERKEQAKRRFITGENDGFIGLILLYGLRLFWSNIGSCKLNEEKINLWNSEYAQEWHTKKDTNNDEIKFFINIFKDYYNDIPLNINSLLEIGAGNGKNVINIKKYFPNRFNKFIAVDFQIKKSKEINIIKGGVKESLESISPNTLVLTSGTAMYFSEKDLDSLFKNVEEKNASLLLLEPTYHDDFSFFRINPIISNYDYVQKGKCFNLKLLKKTEISEDKYMKVYGYLFRSKHDSI